MNLSHITISFYVNPWKSETPKGANLPLTALGFFTFFYLTFAVKQTPHLIMLVLNAFVVYAVKGIFDPLGFLHINCNDNLN